MEDKKIIKELKKLIRIGEENGPKLSDFQKYENSKYIQTLVTWKKVAFKILKLRFGISSDFYQSFKERMSKRNSSNFEFYRDNVAEGTAVLQSVVYCMESGFTEDLFFKKEMLLFGDILKQAKEFLKTDHLLASAIYCRIVLESTIREYAKKNYVETRLTNGKDIKFDKLIEELSKEEIISKPFEDALRSNYRIGSYAVHNKEEFKKFGRSEIREFLSFIENKVLTLE